MKILIIKTSSLGDIVQALPVLSSLRSHLPGSEIDWISEKKAETLIASHPLIDTSLIVDTKKWRKGIFKKNSWGEVKKFVSTLRSKKYDVVFDLQGNVKSGLLLAFVRAKHKVGFASPTEFPNRFFTNKRVALPAGQTIHEDYLTLIRHYFNEIPRHLVDEPLSFKLTEEEKKAFTDISERLPNRFTVLIAPSAFWPNKELAESALVKLLEKLKETKECFFVFTAGSERERAFAFRLNQFFSKESLVVNAPSFVLLQNLMIEMDLVLAMDSFPLHLAQTTATSCFAFFGPTMAAKYLAHKKEAGFFQGLCPYGNRFEKRCPHLRSCKTGACLKNARSDELFSCLSHFLAKH